MNRVHIRRRIIGWICVLIMSLIWPAAMLAESAQDSAQNETVPAPSLEAAAGGPSAHDAENLGGEMGKDAPRTMLFFIVSDYNAEGHILTDETQRREYTLAMMNAATALYEGGLVTDIAIDATQRLDEHGDIESAVIEQPEKAARAILTFMQNVQPSRDVMSKTTGRDIERILAYCGERDICPWIVLVYGDDISKFQQPGFARPEYMTGARLCYVWGEKEPNLGALESAWGDALEGTAVQNLNSLLAPEIRETSLYEVETEAPETCVEVKNHFLMPARNTAFLDVLAIARSRIGDKTIYGWTPNEECTIKTGDVIEAVYYRKDKQAIDVFEQYADQVNDQLKIEMVDGEYSLSVPLSEQCGIDVQVYRSAGRLIETANLHEEGRKIDGEPVFQWSYAPGGMGTYSLNVVLRSGLLEKEIPLRQWKGRSMFMWIENSAPEVIGQPGNRGTFVYLPGTGAVYETIDLRNLYRDRDEQELSFFMGDGREVKNGLIAVGNPGADENLPEGTEWIEIDAPKAVSCIVYAEDEMGQRSCEMELTWNFVDVKEGFSGLEIEGNLLKGSKAQISAAYTVPTEAINFKDVEEYLRSCAYTLAGHSVVPDENNVLRVSVELPKEKAQDYRAVLTLNGEKIRTATCTMVNEPLAILEADTHKSVQINGWGRSAQFEIQLSDYVRMEEYDVLSIGIESEGGRFEGAAENGQINLIQADKKRGPAEQAMFSGLENDCRICVNIEDLNGIYSQNGTIVVNAADQEGSFVSVSIEYKVENATYKLVFFGLLALLMSGLAVCVIFVIQKAKRNARKGLTYRITLKRSGQEISGDADARAWHGNPVTLKQLMLLAALPPVSGETIDRAKRYKVYAVDGGFETSWDKGKKETAELSLSPEETLTIAVISREKQ